MDIRFACSTSGSSYVDRFLRGLDRRTRAQVFEAVRTLELQGGLISLPLSKYLGQGIYELRIRGKIEIRVLYAFSGGDAWLLHAFQKKSQKMPAHDLLLAKARLATVQKR